MSKFLAMSVMVLCLFGALTGKVYAAIDLGVLTQAIQNATTVEQMIDSTLKAIATSPDDLLEAVKTAVAAAPVEYADDIAAAVAKAYPDNAQEIANAAATMRLDAANLIAKEVALATGKDITEIKVLRPATDLKIVIPEPELESVASPG